MSELDTVASDIRFALKACQDELKQVNEQKKTTEKECLIYRKQIVVSTCTVHVILLYYYTCTIIQCVHVIHYIMCLHVP